MDEFYDVFVSYSSGDTEFVNLELLPRLDTAKLKVCIDSRSFKFGDLASVNMAKGVQRSQFTIPVVSDAWIDSRYAGFETLLADVEGKRVMPIRMARKLKIPSEIDKLSGVNLADPVALSPLDRAQLDRLMEQILQERQPRWTPKLNANNNPPPALFAVLETVRGGVDKVGRYKDIHNEFHTMQSECMDCLNRNLLRPVDDISWDELSDSAQTMKDVAQQLVRLGSTLAAQYATWLSTVEEASRLLQEGVSSSDVGKLRESKKRMTALLARQPTLIVVRLNEAAQGLLPELRRLKQVQNAGPVDDVEQQLSDLIYRHDRWQDLDSILRSINPENQDPDTWWPDVERIGCQLLEGVAETWVQSFREAIAALAAAIACGSTDRIRREFRSLKRLTDLRFQRADAELKRLCDDLRSGDGPYDIWRRAS